MLPRTVLFGSLILSCAATAYSQYGTAPSNYYPPNYSGSTFTGEATDTKNDQITLNYTKNSKTETFAGRFERPCSVPSTDGRNMTPSDIPKGTVLTAFFYTEARKVNGQKLKENVILAIAFDNWHGQKVADEKKKIYYCTDVRHLSFRFWGK